MWFRILVFEEEGMSGGISVTSLTCGKGWDRGVRVSILSVPMALRLPYAYLVLTRGRDMEAVVSFFRESIPLALEEPFRIRRGLRFGVDSSPGTVCRLASLSEF